MTRINWRSFLETREGARDGVLIGIALELFRRNEGHWPATLAELSPHYVPQVPVDRFTGGSLHYKIVDDRPVVYSVGADHLDDGGRGVVDDNGNLDGMAAGPNASCSGGDWIIWTTTPDSGTKSEAGPS